MNAQALRTPAKLLGRRVFVHATCTRAAHELWHGQLVFRGGEWLDVITIADGYVAGRAAIKLHIQRPKRSRLPREIVLFASELVTVASDWA